MAPRSRHPSDRDWSKGYTIPYAPSPSPPRIPRSPLPGCETRFASRFCKTVRDCLPTDNPNRRSTSIRPRSLLLRRFVANRGRSWRMRYGSVSLTSVLRQYCGYGRWHPDVLTSATRRTSETRWTGIGLTRRTERDGDVALPGSAARPWALLCHAFGVKWRSTQREQNAMATLHSQGALRDPGLCCVTPSA